MVVNVEHPLIVRNVYWPLLSDFVNILSQEKIALTIMVNKKFFNLWLLRFLTLCQGINVNERILNQHVEYEPQAYVYAFTIELEICAAAMWCVVNHLQVNVRKYWRSLMSRNWCALSGSIQRKKWSATSNRSSPVSMIGCNRCISKRIRSIRGCWRFIYPCIAISPSFLIKRFTVTIFLHQDSCPSTMNGLCRIECSFLWEHW